MDVEFVDISDKTAVRDVFKQIAHEMGWDKPPEGWPENWDEEAIGKKWFEAIGQEDAFHAGAFAMFVILTKG